MQVDKNQITKDVMRALQEDIGTGDVTAALLAPNLITTAKIISREPMLLCGCDWVNSAFTQQNPDIKIDWQAQDGAWLDQQAMLCYITGPARDILTAERTALNFLQTLSGTATQTRHYVQLLQKFKTRLLDTRKTLPGLRLAQKYAVHCAGGVNHRLGLYDAFLIKENHIQAIGSISLAIKKARQYQADLLVEVEVDSLTQLQEALDAGPDRIMLDNFDLHTIRKAVKIASNYACELEVSGGVDESKLVAIAETGVDYISVGALTKSVRAIDLSLLIF